MSDLRSAAEQVVEMLASLHADLRWDLNSSAFKYLRKAENDLKAALEKHAKDVEWMKQRLANWRLQKELVEKTAERDRQRQEYEEARINELEPERTLTDEVIADLWHANGGFHHHFARAVERYLKGEK
jgi:predicted nuclease with TOPRIM domain